MLIVPFPCHRPLLDQSMEASGKEKNTIYHHLLRSLCPIILLAALVIHLFQAANDHQQFRLGQVMSFIRTKQAPTCFLHIFNHNAKDLVEGTEDLNSWTLPILGNK